jgi:hypothetical protein
MSRTDWGGERERDREIEKGLYEERKEELLYSMGGGGGEGERERDNYMKEVME